MTAEREVLIRGDGVAARCCAHLLRSAGFRVGLERLERPRIPAIMLSDPALALIRDVFGRPWLFSERERVQRRIVSWGNAAAPVSLSHSAVVVSEEGLLDGLAEECEPDAAANPEFVIRASRPLPADVCEKRFGSRCACAAEVVLKDSADASSCWIESLDGGWLFLIPNIPEATWLLGVGASMEALIAESRVIAPRIDIVKIFSGEFNACPRMLTTLWGDNWLACGASAIGFDPICGDGTAHAVREGILASAVVRAIAGGGDAAALCAHYEARLTGAMLRHLSLCTEFYRTGGSGVWWKAQAEALVEGRRWCEDRLADADAPRYQLRDFVLEWRT